MAITRISFISEQIAQLRQTILSGLGYVPENVANKAQNLSSDSEIYYPSVAAVNDALDALELSLQNQIDNQKLFYDVDLGAFVLEDEEYES